MQSDSTGGTTAMGRERTSASEAPVGHVSETAFLVAGWRSMESGRPDALFRDPLSAGLAGERGIKIARTLPDGAWVVAIRTGLIDAFVLSAISSGVDTVISVGAGLDTRPYRMDLPSTLHWVEIDHPSLIEHKAAQLRDETPACSVERFGLAYDDRSARRTVLQSVGARSARALALTEGVVGYLSVDEAGALADDLRAVAACELWVTEYWAQRVLRSYQKHQPLRGAPIRFDPPDWETFFTERGWRVAEVSYLGEESTRLHRPVPMPLSEKLMRVFTSRPLRNMGYALLERSG